MGYGVLLLIHSPYILLKGALKMLSLQEREHKKSTFAKKSSENTKKYNELYAEFYNKGYTKALAEEYADYFVLNAKKPAAGDILQTVRLYDKIRDYKTAAYFLTKVEEMAKKLNNEEKFIYCIETLANKSKIGNWRDAEDFRTEHINFMQIYSEKVDIKLRADMYMSLAYADCAAKHYSSAFRLLTGFGYKPQGKNDEKLLEILIAGIYICAKSGDEASIENAVNNACAAMALFKKYKFSWSEAFYKQKIKDASEGLA